MPIAIQMISRSQVALPRLAISAKLTIAEIAGTTGTNGVLKGRGMSGRWRRRKMIPMETITNASRVPMLTSSPRMLIFVNPAAMATTPPVTSVVMYGVRNLVCTLLAQAGSRPSLAIEKKIRGCPSIITTMVELKPAIAPNLTRKGMMLISPDSEDPEARWLAASTAIAIGAATPSSLYRTSPTRTPETRMYSTVEMASEPRIPIGMSFCGFFASWAAVETASKPIYAKKITAAPRIIPLQPYLPNSPVFSGIKGDQFAEFTNIAPAAIIIMITATLIMTITELTLADSLMPITSNMVTIAVISTAGRLKTAVTTPSAVCTGVPGAALSAAGN